MNTLPPTETAASPLHAAKYEMLGQLAGTIAHDFNNVLAAISGCAGLIEFESTGPQTARHLDNIRKSVQRGAGLLRQLQYFSTRADGPLETLSPASAVTLLAHEVRESFGHTYAVNVTVREHPPCVQAEAAQFRQILLNLCTNARDAMPQGGPIEISAESDSTAAGEQIVISVRDHGTGISPEVQARLFEPFFSTKPKGKGSGLGLAIALRLTQRHGGTLSFRTKPGHGSTFTCRFPAAG